eukprot:c211_g1_i1.p1 GENE.c211_g1_i1~~c211_g1_i1.p1  ORF type:complete len:246 (+),score=58.57 c211_g1_i1:175-912(+)
MDTIVTAAKSASTAVVSATESVANSTKAGISAGVGGITQGVTSVTGGIGALAGAKGGATASSSAKLLSVKTVVLGDSSVGKTSIILQHVNRKFDEHRQPSMGCDLFIEEMPGPDGTPVTFQIWDSSGSKAQPFSFVLNRGASCCVLVFDIYNRQSFENVENWRADFLVQASPHDPTTFPFILVGNKIDKFGERRVSQREAREWCVSKGNVTYVEVSAKESINIDQLFRLVFAQAIDHSSLFAESS